MINGQILQLNPNKIFGSRLHQSPSQVGKNINVTSQLSHPPLWCTKPTRIPLVAREILDTPVVCVKQQRGSAAIVFVSSQIIQLFVTSQYKTSGRTRTMSAEQLTRNATDLVCCMARPVTADHRYQLTLITLSCALGKLLSLSLNQKHINAIL